MSDDPKTVPQPNEAQRDGDDIHYHDVDETNVGESARPQQPAPDDEQRSGDDE
jgi:hypothetical protein